MRVRLRCVPADSLRQALDPVDLNALRARVRAADDGDRAPRDSKGAGKRVDQLGIRGAVHRRRVETHLQRAVGFDGNPRLRRSWNDFDGENHRF